MKTKERSSYFLAGQIVGKITKTILTTLISCYILSEVSKIVPLNVNVTPHYESINIEGRTNILIRDNIETRVETNYSKYQIESGRMQK